MAPARMVDSDVISTEKAVKVENCDFSRSTDDMDQKATADSPTSVLEEGDMDVGDFIDPSIITDAMAEEEKHLKEERTKEEEEELHNCNKEPIPSIEYDSMFNKLDKLLNQTTLYSKFLLEKMEDINTNLGEQSQLEESKESSGKKKGRGAKRKATSMAGKAAKRRQLMSAKFEDDAISEDSNSLTEEERNWKLQMEIAPLLTGGALKSYQLKGVKWLISLWQNGLNGILADQMGLGKTVQTIGLLAHLKGMGMPGPFLICAPLSTLSNWINEFKRWTPTITALLYHGSKVERVELQRKHMPATVDASFPVIVTSYEVLMFDSAYFRRFKWKYVIVDEGHRLKNFNCKLVKELKRIHFENALLLTGTPLQNNLPELWALLNFILPDVFTSLNEFKSWFDFSGRQTNGLNKEELDEKRRLEVISKLHAILRPFLLRRMKGEVEKSLPRKKEIILYATMTDQQRQYQQHLVNKTLEEYLEEKKSYPGASMKKKLNNVVMQLRKNCNHPDLLSSEFENNYNWPSVDTLLAQCGKLKLLDRLLFHLKGLGHKVLIFSQMTRLLDILEYYLEEKGMKPCRIDGSCKQVDRQEQIQAFNNDENIFVFLLSTRAGGLGINLTAADTAIIYDSDWNPQMDLQAMDRCHRIGQTRPVHVYRLLTAHSVECRMLAVANSKLHLEHLVIEKGQFKQEKDHPKATLEESDLMSLLHEEQDEEEELVQSAEISEENLLKILERKDLEGSPTLESNRDQISLRGPGWEVIQRAGGQGLLTSVEGYRKMSDANKD